MSAFQKRRELQYRAAKLRRMIQSHETKLEGLFGRHALVSYLNGEIADWRAELAKIESELTK